MTMNICVTNLWHDWLVLLIWAGLGGAHSCACYQFPFGWAALLMLVGFPHMSEALGWGEFASQESVPWASSQGMLACKTEDQETKWKHASFKPLLTSPLLVFNWPKKSHGWVQGQEAGTELLHTQRQRSRERWRLEAIFETCLPHFVGLHIVH